MSEAVRLIALEGKMERVLERLEQHNQTLSILIPKIDKLIDERTEVALLKKEVSGITSHIDKLTNSVTHLETLVEQGKGAQWAINALLAAVSAGGAFYSWWKTQ